VRAYLRALKKKKIRFGPTGGGGTPCVWDLFLQSHGAFFRKAKQKKKTGGVLGKKKKVGRLHSGQLLAGLFFFFVPKGVASLGNSANLTPKKKKKYNVFFGGRSGNKGATPRGGPGKNGQGPPQGGSYGAGEEKKEVAGFKKTGPRAFEI